jgi:hypothetical protein
LLHVRILSDAGLTGRSILSGSDGRVGWKKGADRQEPDPDLWRRGDFCRKPHCIINDQTALSKQIIAA